LENAWCFSGSVSGKGVADIDKDGSAGTVEVSDRHFFDFDAVGTQNLSSGENGWSDAGWWCSVSKHFNHELG
jgi:hypothetical protein